MEHLTDDGFLYGESKARDAVSPLGCRAIDIGSYSTVYTFGEDGVRIRIDGANGATFILPLISGELRVMAGMLDGTDDISFLTGGFEATEYTVSPDQNGSIKLAIRA